MCATLPGFFDEFWGVDPGPHVSTLLNDLSPQTPNPTYEPLINHKDGKHFQPPVVSPCSFEIPLFLQFYLQVTEEEIKVPLERSNNLLKGHLPQAISQSLGYSASWSFGKVGAWSLV